MNTAALASLVAVTLAAGSAFAIDGTVHNATTDKPQPNATVSLLQMTGSGPQKLAAATSAADGTFTITPPGDAAPAPGPRVVQALYQGVTYTTILPPGSAEQNLRIDVYDASTKPGPAKVGTHMMLLEPANNVLTVSESFVYNNPGKTTFNDPAHGTLRFFLPAPAEGRVNMTVLSPNSMPVRRSPQKTNVPNVYQVDFPIKPGDSRIDLTYQMPWTAPGKFETKVLYSDPDTKLLAPQGVKLVANGLKNIGQEPRSKASIYDYPGSELFVDVEGTGALPRGNAGGQSDQSAGDNSNNGDSGGGAAISELFPQLYGKVNPAEGFAGSVNSVKWILAMIFGLLALGFTYLYRRGEPSPRAPHERGR